MNEYARLGHGSVIMELNGSNLNTVINCEEKIREKIRNNPIKKNAYELGIGDNFIEFLKPLDLQIDLQEMLGKVLEKEPGVKEQLQKFGMGDLKG